MTVRSFESIAVAMYDAMGDQADKGVLKAFRDKALVFACSTVGRRQRPRYSLVRECESEEGQMVLILPRGGRLNASDGSVAYSADVVLQSSVELLATCFVSEPCHDYWYGLKAYAEWMKHVRRVENGDFRREYERVIEAALDRALAGLLTREVAFLRNSKARALPRRSMVRHFVDACLTAVDEAFPPFASAAEDLTRAQLIAVAAHAATERVLSGSGN